MAQAISTLVNAGIVVPNEARQRLGLQAPQHGDIAGAPANTWPISAWAKAIPRSGETTATQADASTRILRLLRGELLGD